MRDFRIFKILKSAKLTQITVILMPTAPTPKDHSTARVIRDTLEKELPVLVSNHNNIDDAQKCCVFVRKENTLRYSVNN